MFRIAILIILITLVLPLATAFGNVAIPARPLTIFPEDCQLVVDGEMSLTLDGFIPANAIVSWEVDQGGLTYVLPGLDAILVAPSTPTVITVSVSITPPVPGMQTPVTRQCTVSPRNSSPSGLTHAGPWNDPGIQIFVAGEIFY